MRFGPLRGDPGAASAIAVERMFVENAPQRASRTLVGDRAWFLAFEPEHPEPWTSSSLGGRRFEATENSSKISSTVRSLGFPDQRLRRSLPRAWVTFSESDRVPSGLTSPYVLPRVANPFLDLPRPAVRLRQGYCRITAHGRESGRRVV